MCAQRQSRAGDLRKACCVETTTPTDRERDNKSKRYTEQDKAQDNVNKMFTIKLLTNNARCDII